MRKSVKMLFALFDFAEHDNIIDKFNSISETINTINKELLDDLQSHKYFQTIEYTVDGFEARQKCLQCFLDDSINDYLYNISKWQDAVSKYSIQYSNIISERILRVIGVMLTDFANVIQKWSVPSNYNVKINVAKETIKRKELKEGKIANRPVKYHTKSKFKTV